MNQVRQKLSKPKNQRVFVWFIFALLAPLFFCADGALAQDSPHKNLTLNCENCHVTTSWTEIYFNHNRTDFPLLDRHQEAACKSCHNIEDFSKETSDCSSCHQDVHQAKMGNDCQRCHAFQGWENFDVEEIHTNTRFPLMGRHTLVDCQSCHQNQQQGDFALLTTDCITCHQQGYLATENPNHVANSFSVSCQDCHDMNGWRPAFLANHDAFFPIFAGQHDGAWSDCLECHTNPATFRDFTCLTCHEHTQSKMDAEHGRISGYAYESNACFGCHPTGSEANISENHDADFFPVFSGTHQGTWQECAECHVSPGTFSVVSCTDCHEHQVAKTDTYHTGMPGYTNSSDNCLACHPTGESGQYRNHDDLFFPIYTGTHVGAWQECLDCHQNDANRKEFTCLDCHEHRQTEMDVQHAGIQGYTYESGQCYFCHPDGEPTEFRDHDNLFFPIFTGTHLGQWQECFDCHPNSANRKELSCIDCHEHGQTETDATHAGIQGYVYESGQCYFCHPDGERGEFRDHDNLFFPIFTGTHLGQWQACFDCHPNAANRKEFTCTDCHEHRQAEMDPRHSGIQGYAYDSAQCHFCHPDGQKGDFVDHDNLYFPIFSGVHNNKWDECATCHFEPADRKAFTCFECHAHSRTKMDDKHLGEVDGYVYDSSACYDCHPNGKHEG